MAASESNQSNASPLLESVSLFQGLTPAERQEIYQAAHLRAVEKGELFFVQGEEAHTLYVLTRGRVRLNQLSPEGEQVLLRVIVPGQLFGGVAVLSGTTYPVAAEAVAASEALGWDGETMARLMERYPTIARNALRLLAERIQELQERYRELATERVERRVASAVLRLARQTGRKVEGGVLIDFPLSREDLAAMTGTTLYTVSRILKRWEKQGLVEAGRQRLLIRSPHGLVVLAEDLPPAMDAPR